MREQITILRGLISGLESTLEDEGLPCSMSAQSVADAASRLVSAAGRHDAYVRSANPLTRSDLDTLRWLYQQAQRADSGAPSFNTSKAVELLKKLVTRLA